MTDSLEDGQESATGVVFHRSADGWELLRGEETDRGLVVETSSLSPYKVAYGLTLPEIALCADFTLLCLMNIDTQEETRGLVRERIGEPTSDNEWLNGTAGDAFRHCFFSGRMTQRAGSEFAERFGNAHEDFEPSSLWEEAQIKMDLRNNAIGRKLGAESANSRELADKCHEAACNQGLEMLDYDSHELVPSSGCESYDPGPATSDEPGPATTSGERCFSEPYGSGLQFYATELSCGYGYDDGNKRDPNVITEEECLALLQDFLDSFKPVTGVEYPFVSACGLRQNPAEGIRLQEE